MARNCAICKQLDLLHMKNGVALATCLNEFLVNKARCVQEMFLSLLELCLPFRVFFETWKNVENKDLNVESHRPRKLMLCPELKLQETSRGDAGQNKAF